MISKRKQYFFRALKVLFIIAVFFCAIRITQSRPIIYENANRYVTSDVTYADGRTAHFGDKDFGLVDKGDVVTLHLTLPEQPLMQNATLVFYDFNAVTEVWHNGELLAAYGADITEKGMMIGNHDFFIDIPAEAWGGELTIVLHATENNAFANFTNLKIYPSELTYRYYTDSDPIGFVIALAMLVLGVAGLFACALSGFRGLILRNGLCLVFCALLVSLWMIANKGINNLFGMTSYIWQPLEYIAGYTVAIPMLLFYRGMADGESKWKKVFGLAAAIMAAFFIVATVLNFTNIAHYDALMGIASALMIMSGILLLVSMFFTKTNGNRAKTMLCTGAYIFVPTCLYEVFIRDFSRRVPLAFLHDLPSLIALGILFLTLYMIGAFVADLYDKQKGYLTAQIEAENLGRTLDAIPAGICQVNSDQNVTIVAANDIFYQIIGYSREELAQGKPKDFFAHLLDSEKTFISAKVDAILRGTEDSGEFEFSTVDIDERPLTILVRYFYDRNGSGAITANVIDITDRKRMEEELRIREEDYRTAIEASDHYYFSYDATTKLCTHLFDSEKLFGLSKRIENAPESLVELGLCAPESAEEYCGAFKMVDSGVESGAICVHLQNIRTHEFRWYSEAFRTIFDADGAPLHAIFAFKDITEQREREIAYNIHRQQIEAHSRDEITYYELNLTTGICEYYYGTEAETVINGSSPRWEDMIELATNSFVREEDRQGVRDFLCCAHLFELYEHGVTEAVHEYRGLKPSVRWFRASVSITSDNRTRETRAYCVIEDIEEEKALQLEHQSELERSRYYEEAYEKLSSSVMYGVCKYSANEELSIVFANDIFYQMHGYTSQEEAVAAGFTSVLYAIPPFGKKMVLAAHCEYTEGKAGQLFETEYPSLDANGNRIWILCRGIYSAEEGIFNSSVLNITDRKRIEEELRLSEERYKLALNQSGKVFFFFDVPTRTMRLSQELAEAFGVPLEVDDMPEKFIGYGLLEKESTESYREFFEQILKGEKAGSAIISCHVRQAPEDVQWYKIAFTTIFDRGGKPSSSIITYEDITEQYQAELASKWKQLNLASTYNDRYAIVVYDLSRNRLLSQTGMIADEPLDKDTEFDHVLDYSFSHCVYDEDSAALRAFLNRERLMEEFENGRTEESLEYRSKQYTGSYRWTEVSVQTIRDAYSEHIMAQLLFVDIHEQKSGELQLRQSMEELQRQLENNRIKVMVNQMQPHFLYNALSAIRAITRKDPDYAYDLLYDFTTHLRSSIKALSSDEPIPFEDELKNIRAYLNIEKMRFGDSLNVEYDIRSVDFKIIPLSIQPLAENATRHGIYPKGDEGGTVTIRSYEAEHSYIVEVEDDGVGFDFEKTMGEKRDSVGLKSVIFRIKALMNAEVSVSSTIGKGTKVIVKIAGKDGLKNENDNC